MGAYLGLKLKYLGGLFILMKKNSWAVQKMFLRAAKEGETIYLQTKPILRIRRARGSRICDLIRIFWCLIMVLLIVFG